jgi:hypothetical protein
LNGTNRMELRVFSNETHGHAVLMARLDNLGKGASGAAVQNLRLMLGGLVVGQTRYNLPNHLCRKTAAGQKSGLLVAICSCRGEMAELLLPH